MTKRQRDLPRPPLQKPAERPAVDVKALIEDLLLTYPVISAGDVARAAGITRQGAYYHLSRMLKAGELLRTGAKRGARYRRATLFSKEYKLDKLEEHIVWRELEEHVPDLVTATPSVRSILQYAFTEMMNNAIEHSQGSSAGVKLWKRGLNLDFQVSDDGVGVFRNIQEKFGLPDEYSAIQHLAKGRQTTQPERHTGEGIFFTSKAVDHFQLESRGLKWIVDNRRGDQGAGDAPCQEGTRVQWEVDEHSSRNLREVFDAYTDEEERAFTRTSVRVKLGERDATFVSRSEAKRLANGLESFDEVILDFAGVMEVGQGFVDELFRVWARDHPETKLVPQNMSPTVARVIQRGLADRQEGDTQN